MVKLITTVKNFVTSNKNHTIKATSVALAVMDHVLACRDWTPAATLVTGVDPRMSRQIKLIVGACLTGITLKTDTTQDTGLRFVLGVDFAPTDKLEALRAMVEEGTSIYSDKIDTVILGLVKEEATEKTLEDVQKHMTSYLKRHGYEFVGTIRKIASPSDHLEDTIGVPAPTWTKVKADKMAEAVH